ncbi:MAG: zinc-ribbon domain-containing protein [Frisingicoccus sp.]|uniref:zinc-ribbon domain-containing protein n=1 Tax=Frisingicoccus sp. TaxID=1918627 RepID=UPI0026209919|nr:zinc-ribbon domain-containing protein [Frisingicoccus sp.]MDD6231365.1 zinc-ribbon domain-containing protein [Frisingicoccus sp.]MDY4834373.1 zinc-ribbon domain-containing protein [Frisingicoccus sp.]MDY5956752.1 zinc-ribbon domain-containing protein [Frisingicoccus sp.]
MFCIKCGAEIRPGSRFCMKCGNPVKTETVNKCCIGCGAKLRAKQIFCSNCGTRFDENRFRKQ